MDYKLSGLEKDYIERTPEEKQSFGLNLRRVADTIKDEIEELHKSTQVTLKILKIHFDM